MIEYLRFLKEKSATEQTLDSGLLTAWYMFPEVGQNWLGFSATGNKGLGLGRTFAEALHTNLGRIFGSFGKENVTRGSHLEKLCLIRDGIGRDNISDFTNNGNPVEGERDSGGKANSFARLPEWCAAWSGMFSTGRAAVGRSDAGQLPGKETP